MIGVKVGQDELADMFGVSPKTVAAWKRSGMPADESTRPMTFVVNECIKWRETKIKEQADGSELKIEIDEAKRRKTLAEARRVEIEVEVRRGELVSVEQVGKEIENDYAKVKAKLTALPSKLAPILATVDTPNECKIYLEQAIHEALTELAAMDFEVDDDSKKRGRGRKRASGTEARRKKTASRAT